MRLWVFTNELEPFIIGGLGVVASHLSAQFSHDGQIVTVFTRGKRRAVPIKSTVKNDDGLTVIRIPKAPHYYSLKKHQYYYNPICSWCRRNKLSRPHLVHVHSVAFTDLAVNAKQNFHVPMVYTCHSLVMDEPLSDSRDVVLKKQIRLMRAADRIVVPSDWLLQELVSNYAFCRGKVHVIPNGVQVTTNPPKPKNHTRLLFVGRVIPSKGIEELLKAMAILASVSDREITLDVVGAGSTKYMEYLKRMSDKLDVSSRIQWLGYRDPWKIQAMYSSYSGVVVPSQQESFGLVSLEALANGVPLISTRSGGLANFVTDEVSFIISEGKPHVIAESILSALKDPTETENRVYRGLHLAANYSWDSISYQYIKLFKELRDK